MTFRQQIVRIGSGIQVRILMICLCAFLCNVRPLWGQSNSLTGRLYDNQAQPLVSGTVVLLNPADSTFEFFGITGPSGYFEIRNIRQGAYLLQASFMGFQSLYAPLEIPRSEGPDLGDILLQPLPVDLEGAEVVGEAVPLQIRGDTVVYNAAAFRTKPDAVTEDLLKKLPGIEVDRAGNIKALGEDVNQLYVDGKEFFGRDPKVATRNIPADAVDKVEVYDKRSDESEFTGIDDGTREKTLNLDLREESKRGVFGNVLGGYGTRNRYKGGAKAYRFTDNIQMAGLGMMNNVNQYGFSFGDYLDFQGGVAAMMGGGGSAQIKVEADDSFPINFGQPVDGETTSGAGGLNFSYSTDKDNRTYISYLINGSNKDLERSRETQSYTDAGSFSTSEETTQNLKDLAHRFNFGLRRRIDSTHNLIISGDVALMYNRMDRFTETGNIEAGLPVNHLLSDRDEDSDRISGNISGTYYRMFDKEKSVFKISADGFFSRELDGSAILNVTQFFDLSENELYNQYQDNRTDRMDFSLEASFTQRLGKGIFLTPSLRAGSQEEALEREQGSIFTVREPVDSLSPSFRKQYNRFLPGLRFQWNTGKSQLSLGFKGEIGDLEYQLDNELLKESTLFYFTPGLSWDYSSRTGRKLNLWYSSSVNTPSVNQLLPVVNNLNPLFLYSGNPDLKPEYSHQLMAHWILFDQFSFTSLMMVIGGGFTRDKINWATSISDNLVQQNTLVNMDWDYNARMNTDFSTPVRKLGINVNFSTEQNWNHGMSLVNGMDNTYHIYSQRYSFSVDNRKKKVLDLESGIGATLTHTWYSIQESLNSRYVDLSWFTDLKVTPSERWVIEASADITSYGQEGFSESILVPLLRAEIGHYFLAHNRGVLTLSGYDLLDRDQIVQRISDLNYLRETRSNTIGRYVMLTFTYRLNKIADQGGIEVDFHRR